MRNLSDRPHQAVKSPFVNKSQELNQDLDTTWMVDSELGRTYSQGYDVYSLQKSQQFSPAFGRFGEVDKTSETGLTKFHTPALFESTKASQSKKLEKDIMQLISFEPNFDSDTIPVGAHLIDPDLSEGFGFWNDVGSYDDSPSRCSSGAETIEPIDRVEDLGEEENDDFEDSLRPSVVAISSFQPVSTPFNSCDTVLLPWDMPVQELTTQV